MNHLLMLILLAFTALVAAVGVCVWAFNKLLDDMESDELDHYHEEPYQ